MVVIIVVEGVFGEGPYCRTINCLRQSDRKKKKEIKGGTTLDNSRMDENGKTELFLLVSGGP